MPPRYPSALFFMQYFSPSDLLHTLPAFSSLLHTRECKLHKVLKIYIVYFFFPSNLTVPEIEVLRYDNLIQV